MDLIPSSQPGRMVAPGTLAVVGGIKYQPMKNLFVSSSYSQSRIYNQTQMSSDTYRYGQYFVANAFYTVIPEMQIGVEYIHGTRTNLSGERGQANRLMAMFQYSF